MLTRNNVINKFESDINWSDNCLSIQTRHLAVVINQFWGIYQTVVDNIYQYN